MKGNEDSRYRPLYDGSVWKVMILAAALIVLSTSLTGLMSYRITQQEVIKKLKTNDLSLLARSIANQVEGRIDRALETSRLLADDPVVTQWVAGGEKDERLGGLVKRQLAAIPGNYDYTTSFVVSAVTKRYWTESGKAIDTVNEKDPDDDWFFQTIAAGNKTEVVVDFNKSRKDTFVFVNVLIGDTSRPLGVAGIGLSLKELSGDFAKYKSVDGSRLWMAGPDGTIHLSDDASLIGDSVKDHLTDAALEEWNREPLKQKRVFEAEDRAGIAYDMISYPIRETNMRLLIQIPRSGTTGFLDAVKFNTTVVVVLSFIVTVFFFMYVSRKLADPYKRALRLNEELERMVEDRTRELADKNRVMTESISYATRIQQSVLPAETELRELFAEHLAYWKPRDGVGGDFYWVKRVGDVTWVAVGDCSGHGVPGALMTMLSVSLLNRIADLGGNESPGAVLAKLNVLLKETLHQTQREGPTDDGLDLGLIFLRGRELEYAGTGIAMMLKDASGMRSIKGDKPRIGYRRTPADTVYTDHQFALDSTSVCYLATDGIPDQNGGAKNLSLGRTNLTEWLQSYGNSPLSEQLQRLETDLAAFMGQELQRDDMTLFAFKWSDSSSGGRYGNGQEEERF